MIYIPEKTRENGSSCGCRRGDSAGGIAPGGEIESPAFGSTIRNSSCKSCPLHATAQTICLMGVGPKRAKIMLVGEAPGRDEDAGGEPFMGKAGRLLTSLLESFGIDREDVYISNAVKCRPPDNRTPKKPEILACRKYLVEEIKAVKPELIICLGVTAAKSISHQHMMTVSKARTAKWRYFDASVRATYHPASVFRVPYNLKVLQEDFARFFGKALPKEQKVERTHKILNPAQLREELAPYVKGGVVSLDIETNGLDPFVENARIWTVGFCNEPGVSKVIPIYHREKPNYDPKGSLKIIDELILSNPEMTVIGHNVKFDLKWLRVFGCGLKCKVFDTMIAFHLLDENYPEKGLKHLAKIHTDMGDYSKDVQDAKKTTPDFHYPLDLIAKYNGDDADATFRLYTKFKAQLKEDGLARQMWFNMNVLKALVNVEINGVHVDKGRIFQLTEEYRKKEHLLETALKKELGAINLNSPKQLAVALYDTKGFPSKKETPTGERSTDSEALEMIAKEPVVRDLLEYRKVEKILHTYLYGMESRIRRNKLIHTTFHLASNRQGDDRGEKGGTVTGRLGSDLQQIPRQGDVKSIFTSRFTGGFVLQADYSQIELRVLAHFAQDEGMLSAFRDGDTDFHRKVAARIYRKPESDISPEERTRTKAVNFGIAYCIGPHHLSEQIGTSVDRARKFMRQWYDEFPQVEKWIKRQQIRVQKVGIVETLFGRKRRLIGGTKLTATGREILRQGVNSPIQGTASELTLFGMMLFQRALERNKARSRLVLNIHDAVLVDLFPSEKDLVEELIHKIFEHLPTKKYFNVELTVPTPMEIKVDEVWT